MKKFLVILFCMFFSGVSFGYMENDKQALFELEGKKYFLSDLSTAEKNDLYGVEYKNYMVVSAILEEVLLDEYYAQMAAKKKMTVDQVIEKELKVPDPSEKELKKLYEEKKSLAAGASYEQVKPQLKKMYINRKGIEKRNALVAKLKKKQNYKLLIKEPVSVSVDIDTTGFFSKLSSNAKVKIVEICAYGDTMCRYFNNVLDKVLKQRKVDFVFIPVNLSHSSLETSLIKSGFCAGKQDKYWKYHDLVYEQQNSLSEGSIKEFSKKIKLDSSKFDTCLSSSEADDYLNKAKAISKQVGASNLPNIFINNKRYAGSIEEADIIAAIDQELAKK